MSPSRFNHIDELNYLIKLHDIPYFKKFIESNRVSYKVAMFKAIESGSSKLVEVVRMFHPRPEDRDIELESLHAAFRGYIQIYESLPLNEDIEEFNTYRENMFLYHGRLDKVNLSEINMHDLLSPNVVPVDVCNTIATHSCCQRACLITGVLLVYCIKNSDNYLFLKDNPLVFVMSVMFEYANQYENNDLIAFLFAEYQRTYQFTDYNYKNRHTPFNKAKKYNGRIDQFNIYLDSPLLALNYTDHECPKIHDKNIDLSSTMFEWQYPKRIHDDEDTYFNNVLGCINKLIDQGIELQ